jgi:hypothetical protein
MLAIVARSARLSESVEFDEAADDALGAQHLRHGQHQIGRGDAFGQRAGQLEADDFGDQHRDRLAEHRGLGLDPADAPAKHAETVDHRRVAVGTDQRIRIGDHRAVDALRDPDGLGDVLEIDLVADAGAGRHDLEIVERLRTPAEELVALHVARIFDVDIVLERLGVAELVDHHAMIDDEVDGDERIDLLRVATERRHRVAHRGEIDDARHAGEILHQHARRTILDLALGRAVGHPLDHRLQVVDRDRRAVFEAQEIFEQHLHRERQAADVAERFARLGQRIIGDGLPPDRQRFAGVERVLSDGGHGPSPPAALRYVAGPLARGAIWGKGAPGRLWAGSPMHRDCAVVPARTMLLERRRKIEPRGGKR